MHGGQCFLSTCPWNISTLRPHTHPVTQGESPGGPGVWGWEQSPGKAGGPPGELRGTRSLHHCCLPLLVAKRGGCGVRLHSGTSAL